jgi:hypothetical protein
VALHGIRTARIEEVVGPALCTLLDDDPDAQPLLRLDPSVDLATFHALLEAAGWEVEVAAPGRVISARPGGPL